MKQLVIDCTELYHNPIRSGVQRVVRELLGHWPHTRIKARLARFDPPQGLVPISAQAIRILTDQEPDSRAMSRNGLISALRQADTGADPLPSDPLILIPEVFFDHARCQFYSERQPAMVAYDFLPWLRPEFFTFSSAAWFMPYLRLLRSVPNVAYISRQTLTDYETRIARRPAAGPVLPLGADGLRIERQHWHKGRRGYVSLGSLDTRKNQHLIVEAFISLWQSGQNVPLTLIGRAFEGHNLTWIASARKFPMFRWLEDAADLEVADVLRVARATIYVSEAEGYGLPPVESIFAGIPVIAAALCPSVSMLEPKGMVQLQEVTADRIAGAILSLEDDTNAARLWEEAAIVKLGTWRDFAEATAAWLGDRYRLRL
jgi:glycosyltransferase involved in cell wall biosynthesis